MSGADEPTDPVRTEQHAGDGAQQAGRDLNYTVNLYVDGARTDELTAPPDPSRRIRFGLPPKPDRLEGRADELDRLEAALLDGGTGEASVVPSALHGLGGVGKSALALWFAYEHLTDFSLIWWVEAQNADLIPGQYARFARLLGYGEEIDPEQAQELIHTQLAQRDSWLIVFDNAESRADVRPFIPPVTQGGGSVIVTSRNPVGWANPIEIKVLDPETTAAWLLDEARSDDREAAAELAELLDGLPLAVAQAAGFCDANGTSLRSYATMFKTERQRLLADPAGVIDHDGTVDTTFALSIEELCNDPSAVPSVALIEMCSYVAPDRIPLDLFTPESLGTSSVADREQAVGRLRRYSLISRDEGDLLYVHRLVQAVTRHRLARQRDT